MFTTSYVLNIYNVFKWHEDKVKEQYSTTENCAFAATRFTNDESLVFLR